MPNEFEKQVQQMMDELKLVPSEPVWQKVELQIRKKKDRRRLIFWLPLLALLLGGGLWIGVSEYSNKTSNKKDVTEKETPKAVDNNLPVTTTSKPVDQKTPGRTATIKSNNKIENKKATAEDEPIAKNSGIIVSIPSDVQKNISKKINNSIQPIIQSKNPTSVKPLEAEVSKEQNTEVIVNQPSIEKVLKETAPNLAIQAHIDTANEIFEKKVAATNSIIDSIAQDTDSSKNEVQKQDTASVKKANIKKYATSKWKLNLVATAGSSNNSDVSLFKGLFGSGEKSLAAPNYSGGGSQSGGSPLYYGPSDVKEGFSFEVGADAKKQLARRMFFSAGLRYNYYSNTIQVGNKINQSRMFMDFAVSQYYSNAGFSLQPYHNRYHFISIPVAMDWQLLKKAPLSFYTGFSTQYLIKTNGLVFDNATQSYFYSKEAFNRVQLFFESALTYSMPFKQKVLTFGPQLQYGLTKLEKNNSTYHLTSYGLKAQLQFGKK